MLFVKTVWKLKQIFHIFEITKYFNSVHCGMYPIASFLFTIAILKLSNAYMSKIPLCQHIEQLLLGVKLLPCNQKGNFRIHVLILKPFLDFSQWYLFWLKFSQSKTDYPGPLDFSKCDADKSCLKLLEFYFVQNKYIMSYIIAYEFWPADFLYILLPLLKHFTQRWPNYNCHEKVLQIGYLRFQTPCIFKIKNKQSRWLKDVC